ncbi:MAG: Hsp70 suppressor, GTPase facilitates ribosomal subunit dissociation [Icmadophila ericetorum]|nr:Hsp70 suppressor, GTPase facilitates ribosomal subunit dissociation [Icmadophila ericetorum]
MSRHRFIKKLDLDDELNDFDGGADYDDEGGEELSAEDKEQMQVNMFKVREILGPEVGTDQEIRESLWHYYYDVEKTIAYLIDQKATKESKKTKKGSSEAAKKSKGNYWLSFHGDVEPHDVLMVSETSPSKESNYKIPLTAADCFRGVSWLNVPLHRQAEILIEPLYPHGGLLGGASTEGAPKVSKLAALAAARKKKENMKIASTIEKENSTSSVVLLDKLSGNRKSTNAVPKEATEAPRGIKGSGGSVGEPTQPRKYPLRPRKASTPPPPVVPEPVKETSEPVRRGSQPSIPISSTPSPFAQAVFGPSLPPTGHPRLPTSYHAMFSPSDRIDVYSTEPNAFAGPSPDDIVSNAQNSRGPKGQKGSTKSTTGDKGVNGLTNGVKAVSVDDTPKAKSKNLDVAAEYNKSKRKNAANFVVIGHVDAGKSTLMGRLLYDLKVVDQRTIDRYRKEAESIGKSSFALAWVLDQDSEERRRGVTIDIAMNKFETGKTAFTILDAPGHRDFIPNMIAGASQADFAVLVIDASTGSFESGLKGQTKEHALLVRSMGVHRLIVLINKLDTVCWSQDRFLEIQQQVSAFLTQAGFNPQNISYIPCSGLEGDNIARRSTEPAASWYTGPILLEALETSEPITRALEKPFRLTIGDVFRGGVQNPLSISGRIDAGSVQIADKLLAVPANETAFIKGIEIDDSEPSDWAVAGQNVTLHLSDIDAIHLKSGDVLCSPSSPVKPTTKFATKILAFEHVTPMHVDIHRGRLYVPGRITSLVAVLDKSSGQVVKKKPKLIQPGSVARVVVETEMPVPLEVAQRVVLRAGGETVAAGLLEQVISRTMEG